MGFVGFVTVKEVMKPQLGLTQLGKDWWGQGQDGLCPAGTEGKGRK